MCISDVKNVKKKYEKYWSSICLHQERVLRFFPALLFFLLFTIPFQIAYGETIGQIAPRVGSTSYNTYVWDGKVLKSKSGSTCKTTWSFHGKEVKKRCGAISSNTYSWQNRKFRPVTGATGETTWIWNGTELNRQVGSSSGSTWRFDGHYWFLKQGATSANSWVVSGFVPIPICILIILGLNGAN